MAVLADFTRILEIAGLKTGVLCNAGQHSRADLLAIMKCKDKIRISGTLKSLV